MHNDLPHDPLPGLLAAVLKFIGVAQIPLILADMASFAETWPWLAGLPMGYLLGWLNRRALRLDDQFESESLIDGFPQAIYPMRPLSGPGPGAPLPGPT
jgi:hypothetical protein